MRPEAEQPYRPCEAFQRMGSKRKAVWHWSSPVACLLGLSLASIQEMDGTEARLEAFFPVLINCSLLLDTRLRLFLVPERDSNFSLLIFNRSSQTSKGVLLGIPHGSLNT